VTSFATPVHLLRHRAEAAPQRVAYRFAPDRGGSEKMLSAGELDQAARALAVELQGTLEPGARVLLIYPPGLDFVIAWFGCLYAQMIAVPVPGPERAAELSRLRAVATNCGASLVLTNREMHARMLDLAAGQELLSGSSVHCTDALDLGLSARWRGPSARPGDIAFLQYTSGSTGEPKGVMVSHHNLITNSEMIRGSYGFDEHSDFVSWLPHFHDMGLIGSILQPLYLGACGVLLSYRSFVRDPLRWLQLISKHAAHSSGGPNIAFELCVRRHERRGEKLDLDLSSWRVAFVGAEPVRASTMERFASVFAQYGFDADAFLPCYGLAEATLHVSTRRGVRVLDVPAGAGAGDRQRRVVSCGVAAAGEEVLVVNPETLVPCAPGDEGEIWVSGDNVAGGYWQRPELSEATFRARLAGSSTPRTFLRTGDLGVFHGGELLVTGRIKDLIIVDGQNQYPEDIEETVGHSHPAIRAGCIAAFAMTNGECEQVVVVAEVNPARLGDPQEICRSIRARVADDHRLRLDCVVLAGNQAVLKTSSGKVQRRATREAYRDGRMNVIAESALEPSL
jgi:acyl-CoA synthetase (AMP-forming)/AMP-acid ligase II